MATVMFIPRKVYGKLASRMRQEEAGISRQAGYKVKIAERAERKLEEILIKSDPFSGGTP